MTTDVWRCIVAHVHDPRDAFSVFGTCAAAREVQREDGAHVARLSGGVVLRAPKWTLQRPTTFVGEQYLHLRLGEFQVTLFFVCMSWGRLVLDGVNCFRDAVIVTSHGRSLDLHAFARAYHGWERDCVCEVLATHLCITPFV